MYELFIFMATHWKNNIQIWKFSIYFSKITPFSHILFSISYLGDILPIEIRLVAWFWPIMNILNPILDKDSIYPGSNVVSYANIPLLHLGSVFFHAKFHQHAFLFKTSLMMLSTWSWKMMLQYVILQKYFSSQRFIYLFVAPLIKLWLRL
jgi:hypothetical protein